MEKDDRPTKEEIEFLTLAYNRFFDIYDEVMDDKFWKKRKGIRFSKIKDAFSIYTELLNYSPLKEVINYMKRARPPMESEIAGELFKYIRNLVVHFPLFDFWDEVWVNSNIVNWYEKKQSIDRFLTKYAGHKEVKYRIWDGVKKKMTYLSIKFPLEYLTNNKIYLKDILEEKEGVKFSFILMKKVLDSQVKEVKIINSKEKSLY